MNPEHYSFHNRKKIQWSLFIAIVIIAIFFRFNGLNDTPPGLWVDEAMNGTDALEALDNKDAKVFYPENNGREGLFINLQAISVSVFGPHPWSLRLVSAVIGVLTVIGLYLLTRLLYNWQISSIASFLMAVTFWHVNFSRIGFRAIMLPFILVYAFYFLWKGLKKGGLWDYAVGGLIFGLGCYTYISFRVSPLIVLALFGSYWLYMRKEFAEIRHQNVRNHVLRGFVAFVLVAFLVSVPLLFYFFSHFEDLTSRQGQLSVFGQENPVKALAVSTGKTLAMFNFTGDYNLRHNIPGAPQLPWAIGVFFAIGIIKEAVHLIKRKHGHFSPLHVFLFAWFFVMLLPGFLSMEAPHALRTIGVIPVAIIFAANGLWWALDKISVWYGMNEPNYKTNPAVYKHEAHAIQVLAILVLLSSIGFVEYNRYFEKWAKDKNTPGSFSANTVDIANYANGKDPQIPMFIVVNEPGVLVDGVSIFAQPIKFLTKTHWPEFEFKKKIFYIKEESLNGMKLPSEYILIPVSETRAVISFVSKNRLRLEKHETFSVYIKSVQ